MAKEKEQLTVHRFDFAYCADKMAEAVSRYRGRMFLALTFAGIFFISIGLLFAEKSMGRVTESGFWAYTFIIIGLMFILKGAVTMLMRPGK